MKSTMKHSITIFLLLFIISSLQVRGQESTENEGATSLDSSVTVSDSLRIMVDSLFVEYDNNHSPGAIVGIMQDGKVIYSRQYGMANLAYDIPITSNTRFNLGSASKQFLGFAMALLESRGKLSLDDPVKKYLPDWPEFDKKVTLMHLLTHTSGYRDTYGTLALAGQVDP